MTVSPLQELSGLFSGFAGNTKDQSIKTEGVDSFQTYMDNASKASSVENMPKDDYISNLPVATKSDNAGSKVQSTTETVDNTESKISETKDNTTTSANDNKTEDSSSLSDNHKDVKVDDDAKAEASTELKDKILNEAAKKLGISVEDLEEILAQLGIGAADLCNTDNVSKIVAEVMGEGDLMSLVTDEAALGTVLELNNMIEGLVEDAAASIGVAPEEMVNILEESETIDVADAIKDIKANLDDIDVKTSEVSDGIVAENEAAVIKNGDESSQNTSDNASVEAVVTNNVETTETKSGNKTDNDSQNSGSEHHDSKETFAGSEVNLMNFADNTSMEMNAITETEMPVEAQTVSNQEIIDQIQEHIRMQVHENVTELNMQLNPENLGTVHLNVAAKDGQITAQLITQNESVQAALEAQIAMVKESLEAQGVKVEAIEVTVSSHGFEQNLEQGNDSNQQQEEVNEGLKKATRKLNLGDILMNGALDEVSEEDAVTVSMMQADGNTMDYKV